MTPLFSIRFDHHLHMPEPPGWPEQLQAIRAQIDDLKGIIMGLREQFETDFENAVAVVEKAHQEIVAGLGVLREEIEQAGNPSVRAIATLARLQSVADALDLLHQDAPAPPPPEPPADPTPE